MSDCDTSAGHPEGELSVGGETGCVGAKSRRRSGDDERWAHHGDLGVRLAEPGSFFGEEAALINREAELVQTLHQLHAELREKGDPEAALKALHRQRMAQARERRETTAQAREQRRHERAVAWQARSRDEIGYLGVCLAAPLAWIAALTPMAIAWAAVESGCAMTTGALISAPAPRA
mgnify:CR=1 FL=1